MGLRAASCARHPKVTKRERKGLDGQAVKDEERERERDIDETKALVAMGMQRGRTWVKRAEDVGWLEKAHNIHFKARLFIMHD